MNKIGIGLIGAGWIGTEHARNVAADPRADLIAIADANLANANKIREAYASKARVTGDYRELLGRKDIDAVYVCTPNGMHAGISIAAAQAGKHVMCEKPMAITLADCEQVRDAVKAAGVKYLIGYHRRFNPLYQHVKGLLEQGVLGRPVFVESDYIHHIPGDLAIWDWLGKEDIAGSLFHAGAGHNVDLLRYLCGEIVEVSCFKDIALPRVVQIETEDLAIALLKFANGAIGKVLLLVGGVTPFTFHFALYGTRGTVRNNRIWLDTIPRFDQPGHENDCLELPASWIPDNVQGGVAETWSKLDECFIDILADDRASPNDVDSAFCTSRVCFAVLEAARTGKILTLNPI
jgi:predicted dehydrogenase